MRSARPSVCLPRVIHQAAWVVVDIVSRPGPFTYALEAGMRIGIGDEVRVPLGARVVDGWVVAVAPDDGTLGPLRPVLARRRPGPPVEVTVTALAASAWALQSPVHLLRRARRPRLRDAPALEPTGNADQVPEVDPWEVPAEVYLAPLPVGAPEEAARLAALGALGERIAVVAPTAQLAEEAIDALRRRGIAAGLVEEAWDELALGRLRVSVDGRSGALSPLRHPETIVVLDPVHPNARDEAAPYLEALDLAATRAAVERCRLVVVSAVPPTELLARARLRVASARRAGWPRLGVVEASILDPVRGLEGFVADALATVRRRLPGARALVVVPARGLGHAPWCAACGERLRCGSCGAELVVLPAARGVPERAWCPRCSAPRALRCSACGSRAVRHVRWSVEHVADRLRGVLREPVVVDGDERGALVEVGTIEALGRPTSRELIVLVEPERFFGAHTRFAGELVLYWVHRALVRTAPAVGRLELVVSRAPSWLALALEGRDALVALRAIRAEHLALGLGELRARALVAGREAEAFVHALTAAGGDPLEVAKLAPNRYLVAASDRHDLRRRLGAVPRSQDASALRLELDPREL